MSVALFYDSSDYTQSISAYIIKNAFPQVLIFDTKGKDTTAIGVQIATLSGGGLDRIYVIADVGSNPPSGVLTSGQVTTLDTYLNGYPSGPGDFACRVIPADNGLSFPLLKYRPLLAWEDGYPNVVPPQLVKITGGFNVWNELFSGTATSGAANTLTDSGATFGVLVKSGTAASGSGANTMVDSFAAGTATSGTTGTLTDSGASWVSNVFAGLTVYITAGTGVGQSSVITSNTSTALTFTTAMAVAPDNTSVYVVGWATNAFVGKYLNLTGGVGEGQSSLIVSNTATVITVADAWITIPTSSSTYSIITGSLVGDYLKITGGTNAGEIRKITASTVTKIWVDDDYLSAVDNTSVYVVINYNLVGDTLQDYYVPLYVETYMQSITNTEAAQSYQKLIDNTLRLGQGGNGNKLAPQDMAFYNNIVIPQGKAIYDYLNL